MFITKAKCCYIIGISAIVTFFIILYTFTTNRNEDKFLKILDEKVFDHLPETKRSLFDLDFKYIHNNEKMCENNVVNRPNLLAVFIITSYYGNVETRSAMRRAFSREDLKVLNFRRVFLLGESSNDKYTSQNAVDNESNRFEDIVQGNFQEAYRNLTYKHMMGLMWADEFCKNAKFVIKMDDDIVANVERIPALLNALKPTKNGNFLAGYVFRGMVPIREPANKWYVTQQEYSYKKYPTFVSGWFYITTPNTCSAFVQLSELTKYFWIDDTFVTGILASKLKIKHFDISQYFAVHSEFIECCLTDARTKGLDCNLLVGPNGGNTNLFYEFNNAMNICNLNLCKKRAKPINETCVAERKLFVGKGKAMVKNYKLH